MGDKIKLLRKKMGLNQYEFADLLNTNQPTICRCEKGKSRPNYKLSKKIIELAKKVKVGLTMDELMT